MKILLLAALLASPAAIVAAPSYAGSNDCLFDRDCASRPGLTIESPEPVLAEVAPAATRLSGLTKGASEGATLGFMLPLTPAVELMSKGFDRGMQHRSGSDAFFIGGIALGVILYIPALVIGAVGGLFGAVAGTAAPESAQKWDAEGWLTGGPR